MNNLARDFVTVMEELELGTFGNDIFISRWPTGKSIPNKCWLVKADGGEIQSRLVTGELRQTFVLSVRLRAVNPEDVYNALYALQSQLGCEECLSLEWYNVIEVSTSGPFVDEDIDLEERTIGEILFTITTYKDCHAS